MNVFALQKECKSIKVSDIYGVSDIYFYSYARYAFLEILQKLNIRSIYIPSFICRDMLAPINAAKVMYYFYDVDEHLNPILNDIRCDAILAINYFGFSASMDIFLEYKNRYNAIIIEDNAHGFLSRDTNNKMLGVSGDIGLFSIRKTIFLPNGAALIINNNRFKSYKFKNAVSDYSNDDIKFKKKYKLKKILLSKYFGLFILLFRRLIRYIKTNNTLPLPDPQSEVYLPDCINLTPKLINGEISIDINFEIERRRKLYIQVCKYAEKFDIKPIFDLNDHAVPYEFAFIDNGKSSIFQRFLYTKGLFILPWPDLPYEIMNKCPSFYKKIKVVPFLW